MAVFRRSAVLAFLVAFPGGGALAQKTPSDSKPLEAALAQLVEKHFAQWDRNHDERLDVAEIDHLIENHTVHGHQAALIVRLRRHMDEMGDHPEISHKELLKLIEGRGFSKSVEEGYQHLKTIDRELFLPTDPDLVTFNQGRIGDCYLLSAIAAQAHRSPGAIREMIHPEVTGGFQVVFGDGQKIAVVALTECELLLGAQLDQRHGSWLAVLEKAYGTIRRRDRAKKENQATAAAATAPFETLNTGNPAVIIRLLTGQHAETMRLDKGASLEQVHHLLSETTKKKRLICASKNRDKGPPGIVSKHAYAILAYDARQKQVRIFNPWGNHFAPKGPPGIANGYATNHGQFTMPLDDFHKVFYRVEYETDRPLKSKSNK